MITRKTFINRDMNMMIQVQLYRKFRIIAGFEFTYMKSLYDHNLLNKKNNFNFVIK